VNRCNAKGCQHYVPPHHGHLILSCARGQDYVPLALQLVILLYAIHNAPQTLCHKMTGAGHKIIEAIYLANDECRRVYVEHKEKLIDLGTDDPNDPHDVEADEVDLRAGLVDDHEKAPQTAKVEFEQWGGVQKRGFPATLVMTRLKPMKTKLRAPGPGPIRMVDWEPFANKRLKDRNVMLHTDGARSYYLKVRGVFHDHVVHSKKKLKVNGKFVKRDGEHVWIKPHYVKVFSHTMPNGKASKVKGGTQIIDRFWRLLKEFLQGSSARVGSMTLRRRIRSAQWYHWQQGLDKWSVEA
jgi:hypothetical protein